MPLQRISAQRSGTLVEFYTKVAEGEELKKFGAMMVELIEFLNSHLKENIWALTSHYSLCLLSSDDYRSGWHVEILAMANLGYQIRYRVPDVDSPWVNAKVEGIAEDKERALEYVLGDGTVEGLAGWRRDTRLCGD